MQTTDKVQVGDQTVTSAGTQRCPYIQPKAEQGWECPRCGRINAPWVRQCDCSSSNWTITSDLTYKPDWWKEVTCNSYPVGSDYKKGNTYVNVNGTVESDVTAWNCTNPNNCHTPHYTTETVVNDGIHNFYNLRTSKETK